MKTKFISRISLLLLLALVIGTLASCNTGNKEDESTETDTEPDVVDTESGEEKEQYDPGAVTFNDYDYEMLTETDQKSYNLYAYLGETTPKQLTDVALWQRESQMKKKYGVNLVLNNQGSSAAALETIRNSVGSGQSTADVIMINGEKTFVIAQEGYIYDVNTLPNLNLEASYWDQRIQSEYKVGDSLYCLEGDFNFADELATFVVIYNDSLYDKYGYYDTYGSPYDLAIQGKWTYEKMAQMIKGKSSDKDGNGVMNQDDIWGLLAENKLPYYLLIGSGRKMLSNKEGELTLELSSGGSWSSIYQVLEAAMGLCINDDTIIAGANAGHHIPNSNALWDIASDIFMYDRALFRTTALSAVTRYVDMESDYGIMPIPAYEETSPEDAAYYCWLEPYLHFPMSFPISAKEIEKTTQITEILSYTSKYGSDSLHTAFFELLANNRLCRTAKDVEMLELVFANKCYDMDQALWVTDLEHRIMDQAACNYATVEGAMGYINSYYNENKKEACGEKMKEVVLNLTLNGKTYPLS